MLAASGGAKGAVYQSIPEEAAQQVSEEEHGHALQLQAEGSTSPRHLSRNTLPNRSANPVSKWVTTGFTSLWAGYIVLIFVVAVVGIAMVKVTKELQGQVMMLTDTVQSLEGNLAALRTSMHVSLGSISDDITRIESNYTTKLSAVDCRLDEQQGKIQSMDNTLVKLTNRTSNAEVLDSLHETRQQLESDLMATKNDVSVQLQQQMHNVTTKMQQNQQRMQQTESDIRDIVRKASIEIHTIQANVTDQLGAMKRNFQDTASELSDAVDGAQATIHSEVKLVQDNIEQYVAITNSHFAAEDDFVKYQLAGTFTLLGCLMSGYHLSVHLRHYNKPEVQRRIMAVLWMVPIYGITSWFSLVMQKFEAIFAALRDCYEAYVVYTFIALLIAIMEDGQGLPYLLQKLTLHVVQERKAVEEAAVNHSKRPTEHLRPPFPCCYEWHKPTQVAKAWLYQCRLMALQFVVTKPFFSLVPFFMWIAGHNYDAQPAVVHQEINWASPKLYITFFSNVSVGVAFYGLLSFYHGTEKDLAWCDPWPKFLCIKGVVFMTFWQGLVLQGMASAGFVLDRQATQLQNLLICIEMLLASLAHFYIFPYYEWEEGYKREKEKSVLIRDTLALRDFVTDMKMMVSRVEWEYGREEDDGDGGEGGGASSVVRAGSAEDKKRAISTPMSARTMLSLPTSIPESPLLSPDSASLNDTGTFVERYSAVTNHGVGAGLGSSARAIFREASAGSNAEVLALFGKAVSQLSNTVEQEQEKGVSEKQGEKKKSVRPKEPGLFSNDFFGTEIMDSPPDKEYKEEESIFGADEAGLFVDVGSGKARNEFAEV